VAEPEPVPEPEPVAQAEPAAVPVAEPEPVPEPVPEPDDRPTAPVQPVAAPRADTLVQPVAAPVEPAPEEPRRRRERALPAISGMAASIVTGLIIGVLTVGLTWGSLRLCEVLQGTSSCGQPGFLLLSAIMVAMIVLGGILLRAWGVPDPRSTSFLAVGLTAVIALLFLIDVIFAWWMIIAIPVISAATYALAHWVTTRLVEPADG
jgi:hypothetical protein